MIFVGIDPGKSGGIAALNGYGELISCLPMPLSGKEISPHDIAATLHSIFYEDSGHVVIEHSQAIHKCSAGSTFSFGMGFGMLIGICATAPYPYILAKPKAWQKLMHQGADPDADPKDRSLQVVHRLFPTANLKASARCKKDHDGMVDAILLAEYGRRLAGIK